MVIWQPVKTDYVTKRSVNRQGLVISIADAILFALGVVMRKRKPSEYRVQRNIVRDKTKKKL